MKTINEILENNDFDYVEITKGSNGYPKGLYRAITASKFNNFKEMESFADEHGLELIKAHKRDGWQLWESQGRAFEPFKNTCEDYGDNYSMITWNQYTEEEFIKNEISEVINDGDFSFESLESLIARKKDIWQEIEALEEDEIIITLEGSYYETIKSESLSWSFDTHNYMIMIVDKV